MRGLGDQRGRIARFAAVGVLNTGFDFAVFNLLYYGAGAPLLLANTTGYLVGLANSYLLNSRWTFRDRARQDDMGRAALYAALSLVGLGIANLMLWLLAFVLPAWLAKIGVIGGTFSWNYWSSRRFVFSAPRRARVP